MRRLHRPPEINDREGGIGGGEDIKAIASHDCTCAWCAASARLGGYEPEKGPALEKRKRRMRQKPKKDGNGGSLDCSKARSPSPSQMPNSNIAVAVKVGEQTRKMLFLLHGWDEEGVIGDGENKDVARRRKEIPLNAGLMGVGIAVDESTNRARPLSHDEERFLKE